MNNPRRKELRRALEMLAEARSIIEAMQEEEQEAFDNMPEGLQESERGQTVEENAERLEEIAGCIEEQEEELEDIIG